MTVQIVPGFDRPQQVRELFTEYTKLIIDGDSSFREYLAIQNYDEELLHLEAMMNTPSARAMARRRHLFLEEFLEEFLAEWNGER